jgi:hypothetical protein
MLRPWYRRAMSNVTEMEAGEPLVDSGRDARGRFVVGGVGNPGGSGLVTPTAPVSRVPASRLWLTCSAFLVSKLLVRRGDGRLLHHSRRAGKASGQALPFAYATPS